MRILSIQQVALTTNPEGTEVPLVFENGVFYKIFGNGFESAPFNHDSDNVNFMPVGQGYPTPMLGVITDGKLKLYTTYAPVDYVQLMEFADDTYVYREEVRISTIDMAEITKMVITSYYETKPFNVTLSVKSVTNYYGDLRLICSYSDMPFTNSGSGSVLYLEAYGRLYYPYKSSIADVSFSIKDNEVILPISGYTRFLEVVSHDDYT